MNAPNWMTLLACGGELWLLVLIVWRGRASSLSLPLGLLTVILFGWNFSALAYQLTAHPGWIWLNRAVAPIAVPLTLHVVLVFAGRRRALRRWLFSVYAAFGLLTVWALVAPSVARAQALLDAGHWELIYLLLLVLVVVLGLRVLAQHARQSVDEEEVSRTYLVFTACVLLAVTAVTELLPAPMDFPRLGHLGTVGFNVLLAMVVLRLRLVESNSNLFAGVLFVVMVLVAWLGFIAFSSLLNSQWAALSLAGGVLAAGVLVAGRQLLLARELRRARLDRLAFLGRMSAQLAHDLKNPLAAAKGAAQFLQAERAAGRSLDDQSPMVELLAQQLERMERVVSQYQRLSRVEAQPVLSSLNQVAKDSAGLLSFGVVKDLQLQVQLDPAVPSSMLDPDLLAAAVENLLVNAAQAMPQGGNIRISTGLVAEEDAQWQRLVVADDGPGMSARVRERALDEFFTTKASGSGLGLSFVRRVAEAHGGQVRLESQEGRGTLVELIFPVRGFPSSEEAGAVAQAKLETP